MNLEDIQVEDDIEKRKKMEEMLKGEQYGKYK